MRTMARRALAVSHARGAVLAPPTLPPGLIFGPGHLGILQQATRNLREGKDFPLPLRDHLPLLRSIDRLYSEAWS